MKECIKYKSLYCKINRDSVILVTINIFLKTMIITLFLSFILYIFFGFGGGSIHNYYKPNYAIVFKGFLHLFILIVLYFII